jgi:hypothetical protein
MTVIFPFYVIFLALPLKFYNFETKVYTISMQYDYHCLLGPEEAMAMLSVDICDNITDEPLLGRVLTELADNEQTLAVSQSLFLTCFLFFSFFLFCL